MTADLLGFFFKQKAMHRSTWKRLGRKLAYRLLYHYVYRGENTNYSYVLSHVTVHQKQPTLKTNCQGTGLVKHPSSRYDSRSHAEYFKPLKSILTLLKLPTCRTEFTAFRLADEGTQ